PDPTSRIVAVDGDLLVTITVPANPATWAAAIPGVATTAQIRMERQARTDMSQVLVSAEAECRVPRSRNHAGVPDLVLLGRLGPEQVLDEVVPPAPHHVRAVGPVAVPGVREDQEVEVLPGFDEAVHHQRGVGRRDVVVHATV